MTMMLVTILVIIIAYSLSVICEGSTCSTGALFISGLSKIAVLCCVVYLACLVIFGGVSQVIANYQKLRFENQKAVNNIFSSFSTNSTDSNSGRAVEEVKEIQHKTERMVLQLTDSEMYSLEDLMSQEDLFNAR